MIFETVPIRCRLGARDLGWNLDSHVYPKDLSDSLHADLQVFLAHRIEGLPQRGLSRSRSGLPPVLTSKRFFAEGVLTEVKLQIPRVNGFIEHLLPWKLPA